MGVFFQNLVHHADVVELVDTLDSGSSAREGMKVQVLSSALKNPVDPYRVFRFYTVIPALCRDHLTRPPLLSSRPLCRDRLTRLGSPYTINMYICCHERFV